MRLGQWLSEVLFRSLIGKTDINVWHFLTNIRKFIQILFKPKNCTVGTTYFSPAGNRNPVSRVTGGDTHHYTTEEWGAANLSFNNTNCWKWHLHYYQIDRSDWVNDYQKFYFEVRLVKLISMFDIFLRILGNSFKFRFQPKSSTIATTYSSPAWNWTPAAGWQAGILTTVLPRKEFMQTCLSKIQVFWSENFTIIR